MRSSRLALLSLALTSACRATYSDSRRCVIRPETEHAELLATDHAHPNPTHTHSDSSGHTTPPHAHNAQESLAAAYLGDTGEVAAVYESYHGDAFLDRLRVGEGRGSRDALHASALRFSDGAVSGWRLPHTNVDRNQRDPSVAALSGNLYAVAWQTSHDLGHRDYRIALNVFRAGEQGHAPLLAEDLVLDDWAPPGGSVHVDSRFPVVVPGPGPDRFAVAYGRVSTADGAAEMVLSSDVVVRAFAVTAGGGGGVVELGEEALVARGADAGSYHTGLVAASSADAASGEFVVAWVDQDAQVHARSCFSGDSGVHCPAQAGWAASGAPADRPVVTRLPGPAGCLVSWEERRQVRAGVLPPLAARQYPPAVVVLAAAPADGVSAAGHHTVAVIAEIGLAVLCHDLVVPSSEPYEMAGHDVWCHTVRYGDLSPAGEPFLANGRHGGHTAAWPVVVATAPPGGIAVFFELNPDGTVDDVAGEAFGDDDLYFRRARVSCPPSLKDLGGAASRLAESAAELEAATASSAARVSALLVASAPGADFC